jgi:hypothetical protein
MQRMYLFSNKLSASVVSGGDGTEKGVIQRLTLKGIHGGGSEGSLLSIVGYQLCHPTYGQI